MNSLEIIRGKLNSKYPTICYISPILADSLNQEYYRGITEASKKYNFNLISVIAFINRVTYELLTKKEYYSNYVKMMKLIDVDLFDGFILWSSTLTNYISIEKIIKIHQKFKKKPFVTIGAQIPGVPCVNIVNEKSTISLLDHIYKHHGYRKIAFVQGRPDHVSNKNRLNDYCNYLKENKITINPDLIFPGKDFTVISGINSVKYFLDQKKLIIKKDIEAIITASDPIALGVINELSRRGFKIPQDVAVTGINNRPESTLRSPSITTMDPFFYLQGFKSVEILKDCFENRKTKEIVSIMPELILRQSCGCFEEPIQRFYNAKIKKVSPRLSLEEKIIESAAVMINNNADKSIKNKNSKKPESSNFKKTMKEIKSKYSLLKRKYEDIPILKFRSLTDALWSNFFLNLKNDKSKCFIYTLLYEMNIENIEENHIVIMQEFITDMRALILPYFTDKEIISRSEFLWHIARIFLQIKSNYLNHEKTKNLQDNMLFLQNFGEAISASFDLDELIKTIVNQLQPSFINKFYMTLFAGSEKKTKIILAFNKDKKDFKYDKINIYKSNQMLPLDLFPKNELFNFNFLPLIYKNKRLGFFLIETSLYNFEGRFYSILAEHISNNLNRIIMLEELKESEEERKTLLNNLAVKNIDLEAAKNISEKANRAKSNLLANMSHEIRTPLNAIIGFSDYLIVFKEIMLTNLSKLNQELIKIFQSYNKFQVLDKLSDHCYRFDISLKEQLDLIDPNNYFHLLIYFFKELSVNISDESIREIINKLSPVIDKISNFFINFMNSESENLKNMQKSGKYLLNIINSILDISKIESGKIEIQKKETNFVHLIEELYRTALSYSTSIGKDDKIVIKKTVLTNLPDKILLDEDKIKEIVLNLLSNAVKYTEKGEIIFRIECLSDKIIFTVKDTGIGMSKNDLGNLFQEFYRAENSRHIEGTGLGLALVKKLVDMHKGSISVNSELNNGSEFIVEIPA